MELIPSKDWDLQSTKSTSTGSWSLPGFSTATETDLESESVCSFPNTMNHAFFRLHRRATEVNRIKAKVPNLQESKGVYHCLEQQIWPNRKVTSYQRHFGKGNGKGNSRRAWKAELPIFGRKLEKDPGKEISRIPIPRAWAHLRVVFV